MASADRIRIDDEGLRAFAGAVQALDVSGIGPDPQLMERAGRITQRLQARIDEVERLCRERQGRIARMEDADARERARRELETLRSSTRIYEEQIAEARSACERYRLRCVAARRSCEQCQNAIVMTVGSALRYLDDARAALDFGPPASAPIGVAQAPRKAPPAPGAASTGLGAAPAASGAAPTGAFSSPGSPSLAAAKGAAVAGVAASAAARTGASAVLSDAARGRAVSSLQNAADNLRLAGADVLDSYRESSGGHRAHLPKEGGTWTDAQGTPIAYGRQGVAVWHPDRSFVPRRSNEQGLTWGDIERRCGPIDITFVNGYPQFPDNLIAARLPISQPTGERRLNFSQVYDFMLNQSSAGLLPPEFAAHAREFARSRHGEGYTWLQTKADVREFLSQAGLTIHESPDGGEAQLVPSVIHNNIPHTGMVSGEAARERGLRDLAGIAVAYGEEIDVSIDGAIRRLGFGRPFGLTSNLDVSAARLLTDGISKVGLENCSSQPWGVLLAGDSWADAASRRVFGGLLIAPGSMLTWACGGYYQPSLRLGLGDGTSVTLVKQPRIATLPEG